LTALQFEYNLDRIFSLHFYNGLRSQLQLPNIGAHRRPRNSGIVAHPISFHIAVKTSILIVSIAIIALFGTLNNTVAALDRNALLGDRLELVV
jgi:hypothetical protein